MRAKNTVKHVPTCKFSASHQGTKSPFMVQMTYCVNGQIKTRLFKNERNAEDFYLQEVRDMMRLDKPLYKHVELCRRNGMVLKSKGKT